MYKIAVFERPILVKILRKKTQLGYNYGLASKSRMPLGNFLAFR